ncbi:MAG: hypothetical protein HQL52_16475 [Magnetococcales bacterium]|nr:hypothetical protein [Magnetococcales bacterium]
MPNDNTGNDTGNDFGGKAGKRKRLIAAGLMLLFCFGIYLSIYYKVSVYGP